VTIPQRYAIDFVGLNARGHAIEISPEKIRDSANADWFGYDSDVLAVADGIVRDARDGQPDGRPLNPHPEGTDLTARGLYGNFVVLEIAPGVFAHYAHLRPGSVRVRLGEHVHRGEVLAHLGDSGNSAARTCTFTSVTNLSSKSPKVCLSASLASQTRAMRESKWCCRLPPCGRRIL
jgi:hypothetical protein